jgi:hypothetical protein
MPVLTIEFNSPMNDILQELADKKGCSKVDILRRAVALYKYISNELHCRRKDDLVPKKLVIRNSEDVILKEIMVP